MPKKHQKSLYTKPASTAHHTLASSSRHNQNDPFRPSQTPSSTEAPSVNDLIDHLRRTQVFRPSENDSRTPNTPYVASRSVHPSVRNLLELPETPPPRPRPGSRRTAVGGQRVRLRRIPGPPPPESWLAGNYGIETPEEDELDSLDTGAETSRIIYRLERLPGAVFPGEDTMLHTLLKSMASHWLWHLEYDGQFLAILPDHLKVLLMSYVAVYAEGQLSGSHIHELPQPAEAHARMAQGLRLLFHNEGSYESENSDSNITRLDLSGTIGRYMSLNQLSNELFVPKKPTQQSNVVPSSWEDEDDEEEPESDPNPEPVTLTLPQTPTQRTLRFHNLRYLSLAHPKTANWSSLIRLLSRLPTLTHLSLAHWPTPTVTPNAVNSRIRHPTHRSLTFSYSGTDAYAAYDNNWAEAASILRKLSRVSYCLKWLDLEGCGSWLPALNWDARGPDGKTLPSGPEWNGSWRDIEFVRLGPGWLPNTDRLPHPSAAAASSPLPSSSSLVASIHAPHLPSTEQDGLPWDVELERQIRRQEKDMQEFREVVQTAKAVQQRILLTRKEGRGKWVRFSFGLEDLGDGVLRKLLGSDYLAREESRGYDD
ncbi:hypothetical protein FE257_009426 [Aspergillus nanangensis]|uniref:Tafazzin n=1 Tax=Aspergillus nanangensis TaxID=2582783 RepID=A0AAD4CJW7_ASPNN|nr:hypothetical protein FE257_009426 [Aspergillus nanangensis]